jgi:lipopolysaccharide transport system ATP-binding protein
MSNGEVLIRAEHVSKKFCRSLKRSLWYGAQDVAQSLMPWRQLPRVELSNRKGDYVLPPLRQQEFWAIKDVSFEVRRGECLALVGHNGAGKSTLLKILNSLNSLDSGRITMRGRVGALIELGAGFNPVLTGRENIYNQAALLGITKKETDLKFQRIVDFAELEESIDSPVMNYSSGMKVRLGFAIFATMEPDILLLDEVLAVGDIGFQIKCYNKINELAERCAMIFVSHNMPQLAKISTDLIVLKNGVVSFQGKNIAEGIGKYYKQFKGFQSFVHERDLLRISKFRFQPDRPKAKGGQVELDYGGDLQIEVDLQI